MPEAPNEIASLLNGVGVCLRNMVHHATVMGCQLALTAAGAIYPRLSITAIRGIPRTTTEATQSALEEASQDPVEALAGEIDPDAIMISSLNDLDDL